MSLLNGNDAASARITSTFVLLLAHWISPCERERLSRTPEAPSAPRGGQGGPV